MKKKTLMIYLIALGICNYLIIILQLMIVHANDLVDGIKFFKPSNNLTAMEKSNPSRLY